MRQRESQSGKVLRMLRYGVVLRKVHKGRMPVGTVAMLNLGIMNGGDAIWKARKIEPRIMMRKVKVGVGENATEVAEYYLPRGEEP